MVALSTRCATPAASRADSRTVSRDGCPSGPGSRPPGRQARAPPLRHEGWLPGAEGSPLQPTSTGTDRSACAPMNPGGCSDSSVAISLNRSGRTRSPHSSTPRRRCSAPSSSAEAQPLRGSSRSPRAAARPALPQSTAVSGCSTRARVASTLIALASSGHTDAPWHRRHRVSATSYSNRPTGSGVKVRRRGTAAGPCRPVHRACPRRRSAPDPGPYLGH